MMTSLPSVPVAPCHALHEPAISQKSRVYRQHERLGMSNLRQVKRQHVGGRNVGRLKRLVDIPLEIFFLIVCLLHPSDLLQLSRLSKHFRSTFMRRSSKFLWVAARRNVEESLPDPPLDLSEPKYAAILFGKHCFACGVDRSSNISHAFKVRLCAACWKTNSAKGGGLLRRDPRLVSDGVLLKLMTPSTPAYYYFGQAEPPNAETNGPDQLYYIPEFAAVAERYLKLKASSSTPVLEEYVKERKEYVTEAIKHSYAIKQWERRIKDKKCEFEKGVKEKREESIKERLREQGYAEFDFVFRPYRIYAAWNKLVSQPRELTPRIWRNIGPKLVALIEENMQERLASRRDELRTRYSNFRLRNLDVSYPTYSELIDNPAVASLLQEGDVKIIISEARFQDHFLQHISLLKTTNQANMIREFLSKSSCFPASQLLETIELSDDILVQTHGNVFHWAVFFLKYVSPEPSTRDDLCHYNEMSKNPSIINPGFMRNRIFVDLTIVSDILDVLCLPRDVLYKQIDHRIECMCAKPDFNQPASFSNLVKHVIEADEWHHQRILRLPYLRECYRSRDDNHVLDFLCFTPDPTPEQCPIDINKAACHDGTLAEAADALMSLRDRYAYIYDEE